MARAGRLYVAWDVNYYDDPDILAAGSAWRLHAAALPIAKRGTKDGRVTKLQLRRGVPETVVEHFNEYLDRLVELGLFIAEDGNTIRIRSWEKWNDTQAAIEKKSADAVFANHCKWHTGKRGHPSPKCPHCQTDARRSVSESRADPGRIDNGSTAESISNAKEANAKVETSNDSLSATIAEVCFPQDANLTKAERAEVANAVEQLVEVGATADDVRLRAPVITLGWQTGRLTPRALVRNWSSGQVPLMDDDDPTRVELEVRFRQWQEEFDGRSFADWLATQEVAS